MENNLSRFLVVCTMLVKLKNVIVDLNALICQLIRIFNCNHLAFIQDVTTYNIIILCIYN